MTDRATAPVVGKALEIALILLYIGFLSAGLYGGVIPDARASADQAIAERTIATAVEEIRGAIPSSGIGQVQVPIRLPETIGGEPYRIVARDGHLIIRHDDPAVEATASLLLPSRVRTISGQWHSEEENSILVNSTEDGVTVRLKSS